jgi:Family of unknown function (DUF5329)
MAWASRGPFAGPSRIATEHRERMRLASTAIALVLIAAAHAAPTPAAKAEIEYLLSAVGSSDCRFYRNGTWYDAKSAAAHLRYKYESLVAKDLIRDTDDFIDRAATKSSLSGRDYAIKCEGIVEKSSRQWLTDVLVSYRAAHANVPHGGP